MITVSVHAIILRPGEQKEKFWPGKNLFVYYYSCYLFVFVPVEVLSAENLAFPRIIHN